MIKSLSRLPLAYEERFDGQSPAGWKTDGGSPWATEKGQYVVSLKGPAASAATYSPAAWADYFAEIECTQETTPSCPVALVIHASSDFTGGTGGSGYLFGLQKDGRAWQFSVIRRSAGTNLFLKPWTHSALIQSDGNKLSALCFSGLLQYYINGKLVWEGYDSALGSGRVGLFGSASEGTEVTHSFSSLSVRLMSNPEVAPAAVPIAPPASPVVEAPKPPDVAPVPAPTPKPAIVEPPAPPVKPSVAEASPGDIDKSPLLRPGYLVRVTVYVAGKREIDAEVKRVSDNSQLDMPLIGNVAVEGMTLSDLNVTLQSRYKDFFVNPQAVAEFVVDENPEAMSPWGSVVVLGRVKTPGRVNIPPTQDLTVSAAIQQAGGLDTSAKASAIRLTRRKADGGTERISVDFTAIGKRGSVENDLVLRPGDQIFVPESVF